MTIDVSIGEKSMISHKITTLGKHIHRCTRCGLEWLGLQDEEECPLARLEEEFIGHEDFALCGENLGHTALLLK